MGDFRVRMLFSRRTVLLLQFASTRFVEWIASENKVLVSSREKTFGFEF